MARFTLYLADNDAIAVAGAKLAEPMAGGTKLHCRPALPRWPDCRSSARPQSHISVRHGSRPGFCPSHRSWFLLLVTMVAILAIAAGEASACPMCKAALGSHDGSHGDLVGGFFWSILFMLSMPFVIFGSLSAYMYMLVRRARREQAERQSAPAAAQMFAEGPVDERAPEPVGYERR